MRWFQVTEEVQTAHEQAFSDGLHAGNARKKWSREDNSRHCAPIGGEDGGLAIQDSRQQDAHGPALNGKFHQAPGIA
jgi:hypothetical protein